MDPPALPPPFAPSENVGLDSGQYIAAMLAIAFGALFFGCPVAVAYGKASRWMFLQRLQHDGKSSDAKVVTKAKEWNAPNSKRRVGFWSYRLTVLMPAGDLTVRRDDVTVSEDVWESVATTGEPTEGRNVSEKVFTAAPDATTIEMRYLASEPRICDAADSVLNRGITRTEAVLYATATPLCMALGIFLAFFVTSTPLPVTIGVFVGLEVLVLCCVLAGCFGERHRGVVLPTTRPLKRQMTGTVVTGVQVTDDSAGVTTVVGTVMAAPAAAAQEGSSKPGSSAKVAPVVDC